MSEREKIITDICDNKNFDEITIKVIDNGNIIITELLESISQNNKIRPNMKKELYDTIFNYTTNINQNLKENAKEIFILGIQETLKWLNFTKIKEKEKIKIIIADDNKVMCELLEKHLSKYSDIEILGIANTDEEEIYMIENLKPNIVVTDLVRNNKYSGLDIIKKYYTTKKDVSFLVISADTRKNVINKEIEVAGYITKPFFNYDIVYDNIVRINEELKNKRNNT